uniref:CHCH domain-containing protein n=1 Tax=Drosophila pseudoobscura pseudoobscura TaxID=46245 RepID=B5DUN8_DROPS
MRIPGALYAARGRVPQSEKDVPFQEILPLRLKNTVSGKADSGSDVACLQEMGMLFACMKDNEFVEKYCHKEIQQFQNCFKYYMDRKFKAKKTVNQGFVQPGNNLNYKQLVAATDAHLSTGRSRTDADRSGGAPFISETRLVLRSVPSALC